MQCYLYRGLLQRWFN